MRRRVLALIPARAGSRGLRHKNVQPFAGTTLLEHAVHLARASARKREAWSIVVSTDSRAYAERARRAGAEVPFLRPEALATSTARLIDVVLHAIDALEAMDRRFDVVLLLSTCTPLTSVRDVRRVLDTYLAGGGESVVTLCRDPIPDTWRFEMKEDVLLAEPGRKVGRRQEAPTRYRLNGALYAASPAWLRREHQFVVPGRTRGVVMPPERSVDVEDRLDLEWARTIWHKEHGVQLRTRTTSTHRKRGGRRRPHATRSRMGPKT